MAIYTLNDLRETAPSELQNLPDDVLICEYSKSTGMPFRKAFDFFGIEPPTFLSCDQLLELYSYSYPTGVFSVGMTAGLGVGLAIFSFRFFARKINKDFRYALAIRMALIGLSFAIVLGTFSLFKYRLIDALLVYLVWTLVLTPTLFSIGYVYEMIRSEGVTCLIAKAKRKIFNDPPLRESREVWLKVSNEIDVGDLDRALWAQCLAQAGGDEAKAKSNYMIKRYDQLENASSCEN